jgi:hypothetical protein
VAAAGDGTVVSVWNASGAPEPATPSLDTHAGLVWTVAYSPDGSIVASGGDDHARIVLWRPDSQTVEATLEAVGDPGTIYALDFSPDNGLIAAGVDDTLQLWDAEFRTPIGPPLVGHSEAVRDVAFSPDSSTLATASPDGTFRLWVVDPLEWARLACQVADRNFTPAEWAAAGAGDPYVMHCEDNPPAADAPEEPAIAEYNEPSSLGVSRKLIAVDRSIVIVLIGGVLIAGLYLIRLMRRS